MKKFCSKCGVEVESEFCPNCGNKVESSVQYSSEVDSYLKEKIDAKRNHYTYRTVTGVIMIIIGFCLFVFSFNETETFKYELFGYNIILSFLLPGIITFISGILSIMSKKKNIMLLISGLLYFAGAIINMCGISDVSILFILSILFGILNIVFYKKTC